MVVPGMTEDASIYHTIWRTLLYHARCCLSNIGMLLVHFLVQMSLPGTEIYRTG